MFYMDHPNANENYSEFIGKELVKITRRMFPLSHKKEDTFIAGLSMGGYGAIRNGLKYHDTFGYIAGLSSAMILEKMRTADDSSPMFLRKKAFWRMYLEICPGSKTVRSIRNGLPKI